VYVKGTAAFADEISQIDGKYNINITAAAAGTFPNYNGSAVGPNLINIGSGNYNAVAGGLKDSIAIGNTITAAYAANSGYGIVGLGKNVFPLLTTGFQNIGIGNTIATSMTTGYNNVFIGNSVATGATSTGNTVAIGAGAGRGLTTAINNTFLGAFTNVSNTTLFNSTAIGYGATITGSKIKLGTGSETISMPGNMNISGLITSSYLYCPNYVGCSYSRSGLSNATVAANTFIPFNSINGFNVVEFDSGQVDVNGVFYAPYAGFYLINVILTIGTVINNASAIYTVRHSATTASNGTLLLSAGFQNPYATAVAVTMPVSGIVKLDAPGTISIWSGNVANAIGIPSGGGTGAARSHASIFLLFAT
jgi:hypothetical protein